MEMIRVNDQCSVTAPTDPSSSECWTAGTKTLPLRRPPSGKAHHPITFRLTSPCEGYRAKARCCGRTAVLGPPVPNVTQRGAHITHKPEGAQKKRVPCRPLQPWWQVRAESQVMRSLVCHIFPGPLDPFLHFLSLLLMFPALLSLKSRV